MGARGLHNLKMCLVSWSFRIFAYLHKQSNLALFAQMCLQYSFFEEVPWIVEVCSSMLRTIRLAVQGLSALQLELSIYKHHFVPLVNHF